MNLTLTKLKLALYVFLSSTSLIHSSPVHSARSELRKVLFLLAGDSTTATQSYPDNGGGWGDGFKNFTLSPIASAINLGHDGATTASFIAGGDWANILNLTRFHSATLDVYVTVQFGHNDQKLGPLFIPTYQSNLAAMISNVTAAKGIPIIVSSLSRRFFYANGTVDDTLKPYRDAALEVAKMKKAHQIDLWKASLDYVQEIGEVAADRLDLAPGDETHLNLDGSIVFGHMVADLLGRAYVKEFTGVFKLNGTLSAQIAKGVPTF